jgi:hypothetical protein
MVARHGTQGGFEVRGMRIHVHGIDMNGFIQVLCIDVPVEFGDGQGGASGCRSAASTARGLNFLQPSARRTLLVVRCG